MKKEKPKKKMWVCLFMVCKVNIEFEEFEKKRI